MSTGPPPDGFSALMAQTLPLQVGDHLQQLIGDGVKALFNALKLEILLVKPGVE